MRYDSKSALIIWFSCICEYSFLATSNSKSKNDVEVSYSNNFTKRNESDCFGCEDLTKNRTAPSVVKFQVYGRLGNSMFGYAMLLAMKESFSFQTYLNKRALDQLNRYFIHIDEQVIKPVESICPQNCDWIDNLYSPKCLALDPILSKGHLISYLDDVVLLGENLNGNLRLGSLMEISKYIIRRSFTLKRKFYNDATKILHSAQNSFNITHNSNRHACQGKVGKDTRNNQKIHVTRGDIINNFLVKKKDATNENTIFVGVHVRRRDAQQRIVQKYRLPELKPNYYITAMDQMFTYLKKDNPSSKIIFIFVSDDIYWVKQNIYTRVKRGFNAFVAQTGKSDEHHSIGTDLAILASCNHTILSYGTYSFWAGFLSNGLRVIPKMILNRKKNPLDIHLHPFTMPDEDV